MRIKLFGRRFILEVKRWYPLSVMYGYVGKAQKNERK
jgi:hypothetical protein